MVGAGLALVEALRVGAITFEAIRKTEEKTAAEAAGVWTKTEAAKRMGVSGATLTKYRNVGNAVLAGVTPETHASDWTAFTEAAASSWVSEACTTPGGKAKRQAAIIRAIADHRPGASGGTQTAAQKKAAADAKKKKADAAAKKAEAARKVTKESIVNDARRISEYLTSKVNRASLDAETLDALRIHLTHAAEAVEAGQHEAAAKTARPSAPAKKTA